MNTQALNLAVALCTEKFDHELGLTWSFSPLVMWRFFSSWVCHNPRGSFIYCPNVRSLTCNANVQSSNTSLKYQKGPSWCQDLYPKTFRPGFLLCGKFLLCQSLMAPLIGLVNVV